MDEIEKICFNLFIKSIITCIFLSIYIVIIVYFNYDIVAIILLYIFIKLYKKIINKFSI